jgi:hypothetical protein
MMAGVPAEQAIAEAAEHQSVLAAVDEAVTDEPPERAAAGGKGSEA